jgi:molybdenum cofactor synthesis domain-containing protein
VPLVALADARRRVLAGCTALHPRAVALDDALGCVTSMSIRADEPVPPFANSAMDGFALQAADTPGTLEVVATLAAGSSPEGVVVGPGHAVRIMTGAAVPEGADAIVMVERTTTLAGAPERVRIDHAAVPGDHVRAAGEDVVPGQEVFPASTPVTPAVLGVLASLGLARVPVYPRARVGVLSTGDELVEAGAPMLAGQIRDSNRPLLLGLCRQSGFTPVDLGVARDTEADVRAAIQRGLSSCDAILTSGGVSMGDFDYVKVVLDELSGGTFSWMQVAIRPAKPFAFGVIGEVPVFGLPGNPASSLVSFECFARPGIRLRMGVPDDRLGRPAVEAVADDGLARRPDGRVHLLRVETTWRDGAFHVRDAGGQSSNLLRLAALANGLAVVPDGDGIEPGGPVETWLLD